MMDVDSLQYKKSPDRQAGCIQVGQTIGPIDHQNTDQGQLEASGKLLAEENEAELGRGAVSYWSNDHHSYNQQLSGCPAKSDSYSHSSQRSVESATQNQLFQHHHQHHHNHNHLHYHAPASSETEKQDGVSLPLAGYYRTYNYSVQQPQHYATSQERQQARFVSDQQQQHHYHHQQLDLHCAATNQETATNYYDSYQGVYQNEHKQADSYATLGHQRNYQQTTIGQQSATSRTSYHAYSARPEGLQQQNYTAGRSDQAAATQHMNPTTHLSAQQAASSQPRLINYYTAYHQAVPTPVNHEPYRNQYQRQQYDSPPTSHHYSQQQQQSQQHHHQEQHSQQPQSMQHFFSPKQAGASQVSSDYDQYVSIQPEFDHDSAWSKCSESDKIAIKVNLRDSQVTGTQKVRVRDNCLSRKLAIMKRLDQPGADSSQRSQQEPQQHPSPPGCPTSNLPRVHSAGTLASAPTAVKTNQCHICSRLYARPSTLKTHLRTHTNERPYKCVVCHKTFSQAANLTAHQRVHTGERPFPCPICGRQFSQSSSVITHLRTHSGERPYRCNMCHRTFSDSSTLTKHCRIHSGEKPYGCDYCPLNFSQSGNLSRHLRLHLMGGLRTSNGSTIVGVTKAPATSTSGGDSLLQQRRHNQSHGNSSSSSGSSGESTSAPFSSSSASSSSSSSSSSTSSSSSSSVLENHD